MELVRWNPMREMFNLRSRFDSLFDDFFAPRLKDSGEQSLWNWNPAVDVYEDDHHYVIKAELPGVEKDKIAVDVKGRVLSLKGERSSENEVKEEKFYRRECTYGKFERTFTLPAEVDPESVKAEYKDGILKIEVPKPEEQKPKQIAVN